MGFELTLIRYIITCMTKHLRAWYPIVIISLILVALYFTTRLYHLTSLPIFTDEAIYIRWAQIGGRDASWRFISLTDGKQPMFAWALMLFLRLIPGDPLFVGRLTSVAFGFLGMVAMGLAGGTIFKSKKAGVISAVLYLIYPNSFLYDRMALYDSAVGMFSLLSLTIGIWMTRSLTLSGSLLFGMALGMGMLNKTSGFLSLYLSPLFILLIDWTKKGFVKRVGFWMLLTGIAFVLSQIFYSVLRLSPYFYIIAQKDTIFVYPYAEWITHPWTFFLGNLHGIWDWTQTYVTYPVLLAALGAFFVNFRFTKEKLILLAWYIAPVCGLALFGKVLYPRFIFFMTLPLLLLSAYTLTYIWERMKNKWLAFVICTVVLFQMVRLSAMILNDIKSAPLGRSDKGQYVNDWPSGWGAKEVAEFLKVESEKGPVAVYTEGTFGLLPYAFEIYLDGVPNIEIHGLWPMPADIPPEIIESSEAKPTYFVTNLSQGTPDWPLTFISEYQKGLNGTSFMKLYQVRPPSVSQ